MTQSKITLAKRIAQHGDVLLSFMFLATFVISIATIIAVWQLGIVASWGDYVIASLAGIQVIVSGFGFFMSASEDYYDSI